jgi:acetyl esterase
MALDWLHGDFRQLRETYERACTVNDTGPADWRTAGCDVRLYVQTPRLDRHPGTAIVYFHGGGFVAGSPLTHADITRALCEEAGMTLVSAAYRLAPEHPAPGPVEDGLAALSAVLAPDTAWGGKRGVVLCGDSAGGAIALAVERAAANYGDAVRGACSLYGCFGVFAGSLQSFGSRADGLDEACIRRFWRAAHGAQATSPYSIDALAHRSGPPVYLLAAGKDPLRDDTLELARAFQACGRQHELHLVEDATHGFLHGAARTGPARDALRGVARWMERLSAPRDA